MRVSVTHIHTETRLSFPETCLILIISQNSSPGNTGTAGAATVWATQAVQSHRQNVRPRSAISSLRLQPVLNYKL